MTAYTEAMNEVIVKTVGENGGSMSKALSEKMATMPVFTEAGKTARSIVAKSRTLNIPYEKIVRDIPNVKGTKVELVSQLEAITGLEDMTSLANARIDVIERLVDYLRS